MGKIIWSLASFLLGSYFFVNFANPFALNPDNLTHKQIATQQEISEISLGYSNWAGWWPWAIAESQGIFQKHGLNVDLRWYDDYTKSLEDLAGGYLDANSQTLSDTIAFEEESQNIKGKVIVLVNDNSAGNDKIIANKEIKSVRDLKGKTVAIEAGVVDDFLLTLALNKVKVSRDSINILDAETGAAVEAFVADQADAVGAFPPFWQTALTKEGSHEIASSKDFPGAIPDLLVVSRDLVQQKKAEVQELVAVWFDTLAWMEKHPLEADKIMAERAGVSVDELHLLLKGTRMFDIDDNLVAFRKSTTMKSLYGASREISRFLDASPKLNRLIDPEFIRNYASSADRK